MPAHARKAVRKAATAALAALEDGQPAGGTLPPVEASRAIPLILAGGGTFPRTLVYTREDNFVEEIDESPYRELRRIRLSVQLQAKASSGEASQDQLDDWSQEIEDVILRLGADDTALAAAGLGDDDAVDQVLFAEAEIVANTEQQPPISGLILGFDVFYLHQPGDRTGYPAASAIKMDASEEAVPDVDAGDVQAETTL